MRLQEKMRGQRGRLRALAGPGYVMSTKVIFRRAEVFVLAEVCLPRHPRAVLPRSQVLSEKRKWRRTLKADEYLYSSCLFKRQYTGV